MGAKNSRNELFLAVNAHKNYKFSLSLDKSILKTSVSFSRRIFAILTSNTLAIGSIASKGIYIG